MHWLIPATIKTEIALIIVAIIFSASGTPFLFAFWALNRGAVLTLAVILIVMETEKLRLERIERRSLPCGAQKKEKNK